MYKIHNGITSNCIKETFVANDQKHSRNIRNRNQLLLPRSKHEFRYETFQYQGAYVWNY